MPSLPETLRVFVMTFTPEEGTTFSLSFSAREEKRERAAIRARSILLVQRGRGGSVFFFLSFLFLPFSRLALEFFGMIEKLFDLAS